MSLKKEYVRDGKRQIIGSITSGFSDESAIVRDGGNKLSGRTSERYETTRDDHGNLVSIDHADAGLLIGKHNKK
jgi:YD repeat-containing protein